ncbi:MAG: Unknown protein [uncultured Sulfurovum sp.]|uniref:Uncharacterized protein n=1 Tax=uncultured Sulfurovum sp. TaxID=269237 RepID=A0A6S6SJV9_9BACT|nr:MAG: Unknown protein [uncultured Sulfurovum sp.]
MIMKNQNMRDMKFFFALAKFENIRTASEFSEMMLRFLEINSLRTA